MRDKGGLGISKEHRDLYESVTIRKGPRRGQAHCPGCGSVMQVESRDDGTYLVCPNDNCAYEVKIG